MDTALSVSLLGVPGSPYTRKMLAVLRYRRIPYRLILGSHRDAPMELPRPRVQLLPVFYFSTSGGGLEAVVDSTPIIRRLESEHPGRSVIPQDPVLAFLNDLLEDYADEWLTKIMFHYRWHFPEDIKNAGKILPLWSNNMLSGETLEQVSKSIIDRQVGRLYVVGSNENTARIIEESYLNYLGIVSRHLECSPFLLGSRAASCDFAAFGQLTQLTQVDPTPMALARDHGPRVMAWVGLVEDLSGLEPDPDGWISRDQLPATLLQLLKEVGRTYVPVMLANAHALKEGAQRVETKVAGKPWVQDPFPYHGRCLTWLREAYEALCGEDRRRTDEILKDTGCDAMFQDG
ncbi:MAG: glutathione S-transferase N-terminal domain-containing protein [Alphaproteobacteria bacterium]|nr:glutathione S-transferase N-terminal domain-containing protein [Alphaproteobacteria bacterium]